MKHTTPEPYQISVSDAALSQLRDKLSTATFPDELVDSDWAYGAPLNDIKRLAKYWEESFDWRKAETQLNGLPNFQTSVQVDGFAPLDIHFVHQRSPVVGAIPLLFCHGWPGSFIEVSKLLPRLNGNDGLPAFHVVAPSLPNFGFSDGVKTKGFGLEQYAETLHKLMQQLGYHEYVTQGGDWGMWITRTMDRLYPESVKASHINMIHAKPPKWSSNPILSLQHILSPYTAAERAGRERNKWFTKDGYGYNLLQRTKPQTIGYALADSPVALLGWIYEKLHDWTDSYPWTDDEILTWISIYWFSIAGPAASARIYYEAAHEKDGSVLKAVAQYIPKVKLGMAFFPKELEVVPKTWARTIGPVVYESEWDHGGHFAAWERPESIAGDLQKMFKKGGPCYNIVKGASGYTSITSRL